RGSARPGGLPPEALYKKAIANRPAEIARINRVFDEVDVLVMPVMGGTALPIRRWEGRSALYTVLGMRGFYPYCVPGTHTGNPPMSIPFGLGADGMPLAIQVIGRPHSESLLISLAAQIEAERPWADLRPPIS